MRTLRAIPAALTKGFSEWQTLLVLLGVTLLGAAIAVLPDLPSLLRFYGHAPLAEGRPLLSSELLLGVSRAYPPGTPPLQALGVALLVTLPLTLFVTGGVVWRAWTVDRFGLVDFVSECARMFGRVVRTLLWSLPLLAVCAGLSRGAGAILHRLNHDTFLDQPDLAWLTDRPTLWACGHLALGALLWALWRLTLDTARVLTRAEELRQTRRAVWRALVRVLRSPLAWLAYAVLGLFELGAIFLVMRLHAMLPEGNTALAWLALLVGQAVVLVRAGFQVGTTAFAADLVRRASPLGARAPAAAPAPGWQPGLAAAPVTASLAGAAPGAAEEASPPPGDAEPFELVLPKPPARSDSTSEMPMVDADLVDEEPQGGRRGGG